MFETPECEEAPPKYSE